MKISDRENQTSTSFLSFNQRLNKMQQSMPNTLPRVSAADQQQVELIKRLGASVDNEAARSEMEPPTVAEGAPVSRSQNNIPAQLATTLFDFGLIDAPDDSLAAELYEIHPSDSLGPYESQKFDLEDLDAEKEGFIIPSRSGHGALLFTRSGELVLLGSEEARNLVDINGANISDVADKSISSINFQSDANVVLRNEAGEVIYSLGSDEMGVLSYSVTFDGRLMVKDGYYAEDQTDFSAFGPKPNAGSINTNFETNRLVESKHTDLRMVTFTGPDGVAKHISIDGGSDWSVRQAAIRAIKTDMSVSGADYFPDLAHFFQATPVNNAPLFTAISYSPDGSDSNAVNSRGFLSNFDLMFEGQIGSKFPDGTILRQRLKVPYDVSITNLSHTRRKLDANDVSPANTSIDIQVFSQAAKHDFLRIMDMVTDIDGRVPSEWGTEEWLEFVFSSNGLADVVGTTAWDDFMSQEDADSAEGEEGIGRQLKVGGVDTSMFSDTPRVQFALKNLAQEGDFLSEFFQEFRKKGYTELNEDTFRWTYAGLKSIDIRNQEAIKHGIASPGVGLLDQFERGDIFQHLGISGFDVSAYTTAFNVVFGKTDPVLGLTQAAVAKSLGNLSYAIDASWKYDSKIIREDILSTSIPIDDGNEAASILDSAFRGLGPGQKIAVIAHDSAIRLKEEFLAQSLSGESIDATLAASYLHQGVDNAFRIPHATEGLYNIPEPEELQMVMDRVRGSLLRFVKPEIALDIIDEYKKLTETDATSITQHLAPLSIFRMALGHPDRTLDLVLDALGTDSIYDGTDSIASTNIMLRKIIAAPNDTLAAFGLAQATEIIVGIIDSFPNSTSAVAKIVSGLDPTLRKALLGNLDTQDVSDIKSSSDFSPVPGLKSAGLLTDEDIEALDELRDVFELGAAATIDVVYKQIVEEHYGVSIPDDESANELPLIATARIALDLLTNPTETASKFLTELEEGVDIRRRLDDMAADIPDGLVTKLWRDKSTMDEAGSVLQSGDFKEGFIPRELADYGNNFLLNRFGGFGGAGVSLQSRFLGTKDVNEDASRSAQVIYSLPLFSISNPDGLTGISSSGKTTFQTRVRLNRNDVTSRPGENSIIETEKGINVIFHRTHDPVTGETRIDSIQLGGYIEKGAVGTTGNIAPNLFGHLIAKISYFSQPASDPTSVTDEQSADPRNVAAYSGVVSRVISEMGGSFSSDGSSIETRVMDPQDEGVEMQVIDNLRDATSLAGLGLGPSNQVADLQDNNNAAADLPEKWGPLIKASASTGGRFTTSLTWVNQNVIDELDGVAAFKGGFEEPRDSADPDLLTFSGFSATFGSLHLGAERTGSGSVQAMPVFLVGFEVGLDIGVSERGRDSIGARLRLTQVNQNPAS